MRGLIGLALVAALVLAGPALAQQPLLTPKQVYAEEQYLWAMLIKLSKYRYRVDAAVKDGTTVVKILIARDGQLLDAWVVRSSGVPQMDTAVIVALRQSSPYAPLPPEIPGSPATLRLPVVMRSD